MKTYLHLYTQGSDDPVFYQIIDRDIQLQKDEEFQYTELFYFMLDPNAQKDFDSFGLKTGKYCVYDSKIQDYPNVGSVRHIFLKPI